jgi:diguanylate cyclase (GGDEF)-like protein
MTPPPVILVCDHRGEGLAELAGDLSGGAWRVQASSSLRQSLDLLRGTRPDLVVLDPLAGGGTFELELVAREGRRDGVLPVLFVTDPPHAPHASGASGASGGHERGLSLGRVEALADGAWDVIRRDAGAAELVLRIERLLAEALRAGELEEMRYRALHDDRTHLLRPAAFQKRLEEHFSAAGRHGFELALLLVDLDDFGRVNKRFDHTVGDRVIESVGEAIRRNLRAEDVAGRLGGDEFAVLLPYTKKIEAAHVVTRLRDEIHKLSGPVPHAGAVEAAGAPGTLSISASIGFETYDGTDLESAVELRAHAEVAMREAKRAGGNRGAYYRALR